MIKVSTSLPFLLLMLPSAASADDSAQQSKRLRLEIGAMVAVPHGDRFTFAETSPAINVSIGYDILSQLSLHWNFRHYLPLVDDNAAEPALALRDIGVGIRYRRMLHAVQMHAELGWAYQTREARAFGVTDESTELGALASLGATYFVTSDVGIRTSVDYVSVFDDLLDSGWVTAGAGLHARF